MEKLFERNGNPTCAAGGGSLFYGDMWRGQTFTPQITHKITKIKLGVWRVGNAGPLIISIRKTSEGKPVGEDLVSLTVDPSTLPTDDSWYWTGIGECPEEDYTLSLLPEFTLPEPVTVEANQQYAIIFRSPTSPDSSNCINFSIITEEDTYPRGDELVSQDGGDTWSIKSGWDIYFAEYGEEITEEAPSPTLTEQITNLMNVMVPMMMVVMIISLLTSVMRSVRPKK